MESWCLGFQLVVIAHFSSIVSTCYVWFQQTWMRPCDWWISPLPPPPVLLFAQITPNSVNLLSFIKWRLTACVMRRMRLLQVFNVFTPSKSVCIVLKIHFNAFYAAWGYFIFLLLVFLKGLRTIWMFYTENGFQCLWFWCLWWLYQLQLITSIKTLLSFN